MVVRSAMAPRRGSLDLNPSGFPTLTVVGTTRDTLSGFRTRGKVDRALPELERDRQGCLLFARFSLEVDDYRTG